MNPTHEADPTFLALRHSEDLITKLFIENERLRETLKMARSALDWHICPEWSKTFEHNKEAIAKIDEVLK